MPKKIVSQLVFLFIINLLILPFSPLNAAYTTVQPDPEAPYIAGDAETTIVEGTGLGYRSPVDTAALIINWTLTLLGLFFLILVIYGGVIWMLARGNDDEVNKAKEIIKAAVIGLVVILISYGLSTFIFTVLVNISQK